MGRFFYCSLFFSRGRAAGGVDRCQSCQPWKVLHAVTMGAWGPWAWRAGSSVSMAWGFVGRGDSWGVGSRAGRRSSQIKRINH